MMDYFEQAKSFLSRYYPHALEEPPYTGDDISHDPTRPFVTLTYAQSLDGKIGGQNGQQIRLSGQASMAMTHRMRTLHDAILVGIGTVWHDDPRLAGKSILHS
jgi:2,5-diamino-6-(ribosylamino)-4(3H)-pyrimidinone 5'-phosphate reductase